MRVLPYGPTAVLVEFESLEQVMDRLFDDMRIDFIPSLMGEANVDFGINLYKLID